MKTPLCDVCVKSDILCNSCKEKLEKGLITEKEIEVSRFLYSLEEKVKNLKEAKLVKVIDSNNLFIITGSHDGAKFVGRQGSIVKALAKKYNKPIKVVEMSNNFRQFAEAVISPAQIEMTTTVYREGSEIKRAIISGDQRKRLPIMPEEFSKLIKAVYNLEAEIVFE